MYARRTTIGVRLLQLHTIVVTAMLKQYIRNVRTMKNVGQMIVINEELIAIKTGYGGRCIDIDLDR